MIRLTALQFRLQAAIASAALTAAVILLVITGRNLAHLYDISGIATCRAHGNCGPLEDGFLGQDKFLRGLLGPVMLALPALLGIFWGAPLIARELETGTYRLAWTQSITRTHWLAVKIAVVSLCSMVVVGVFSLVVNWWFSPIDKASMKGASAFSVNRFSPGAFDERNITPIGYTLFAVALGVTAGLLLRRTVPAMVATLAVFIGVQLLVPNFIRPNLLPATTIAFPINQTTANKFTGIYTNGGGSQFYYQLPVPNGAWVTSAPPVEDSSNRVVPAYSHERCLFPPTSGGPSTGGTPARGHASAVPSKGGGPAISQTVACLARFDLHQSVTYQPPDHYWPLQWYETGIFLALAAALSGACFWSIRRRRS